MKKNEDQEPYLAPKGYLIKLSYSMLIALVDIDTVYDEDDSPRRWPRTVKALRDRGLVKGPDKRLSVTRKGTAHLEAALYNLYEVKAPRHSKRPYNRKAAA